MRLQTTPNVFTTETDVVLSTALRAPTAAPRRRRERNRRGRCGVAMTEDRPGRQPTTPPSSARSRAGRTTPWRTSMTGMAPRSSRSRRRLTSDRGVAEEVVQETFLALWNRAESFDPAPGSLAAWLHTIARNRTVDRLRAAGRRPHARVAAVGGRPTRSSRRRRSSGAAAGGAVVAGAAVADRAGGGRRRARTPRAIRAGARRDAGRGADGHRAGLPRGAVADRRSPSGSDWPLGTVKTRTRRALRRLREAARTGNRDDAIAMPVATGEDG